MALLETSDVHGQLKRLLGFNAAIVVDCWRVGNQPGMDFVGNQRTRYESEQEFVQLADKVAGLLLALSEVKSDEENKIVVVCDLFAEGNEPRPGIEWSHDNRVKGAILGVMSCLLVLNRHPMMQFLLFANPERLVIGTIEDGKIIVQEGQGVKMVQFLRDKNK